MSNCHDSCAIYATESTNRFSYHSFKKGEDQKLRKGYLCKRLLKF